MHPKPFYLYFTNRKQRKQRKTQLSKYEHDVICDKISRISATKLIKLPNIIRKIKALRWPFIVETLAITSLFLSHWVTLHASDKQTDCKLHSCSRILLLFEMNLCKCCTRRGCHSCRQRYETSVCKTRQTTDHPHE